MLLYKDLYSVRRSNRFNVFFTLNPHFTFFINYNTGTNNDIVCA